MLRIYIIVVLVIFVVLLITLLGRTVFARGPCDRLIAGSLAANVVTFILLMAAVLEESELYLDAALAAAVLSFSGTIIIAKWITDRKLM